MPRRVVIDCFPESASRYAAPYAVVAVDVFRATTTAVTAVALGRDCHVVPSLEAATALASLLPDPLLVGEVAGDRPPGFHLNNSPTELAARDDAHRPMILLTTSGTRLMWEATHAAAVYVACLRNLSAYVAYLAARHDRVAVIGAGARGEFRSEDALCCGWIAEQLVAAGFEPENGETADCIGRWSGADVDVIANGASADYLRRSGQQRDIEFVLAHVDDLAGAFLFDDGRVRPAPATTPPGARERAA